jgi:hypothetical protein
MVKSGLFTGFIFFKKMKQKTQILLNLLLILICAVVLVGLLAMIRGSFTIKKNGFNRKLINRAVVFRNKISNDSSIVKISGMDNGQVYFSCQKPGLLLRTDLNLQHGSYFQIPVLTNEKISAHFDIQIDSNMIYLFAGNVPAVYVIPLKNIQSVNIIPLPITFTRSALTGQHQAILRILQKKAGKVDQVFARLNLADGSLLYETSLSEWRGDLGFANDGILRYDALTRYLVYSGFYTNKLMVFDTRLQLVCRSRTIDTTRRNATDYNALKIGRQTEFGNTSPKKMVNSQCCVDQGKLFMQSELQADHESQAQFNSNSVIDVYRIKDGSYSGSFYVPFDHGRKLFRFQVYGKLFIAVYKDHLVTYDLSHTLRL